MTMYAAIQQRIVDLQPCIFGMLEDRKWAMRSYVEGLRVLPGAADRRGGSLRRLLRQGVSRPRCASWRTAWPCWR